MSKDNGKLLDFLDAVFAAVEEYVDGETEVGDPVKEETVNLCELAMMVADETGMKARCVYNALECAFALVKEQELTVIVEDDDDECEIEED